MTRLIHSGLYEELITSALEAEINARKTQGWWVDVRSTDRTVRPEILARHIYKLLRCALEEIPGNENTQSTEQIALVNRLVEVLFKHGVTTDNQVTDTVRIIAEVVKCLTPDDNPTPTARPALPLRRTGLLVNGRRDVQIASEIEREIPSADRIDLLCAFVRYSGLRLFQSELEKRVQEGTQIRVITSVYTGSTERRALDALINLGAQVKISFEVARTRLHAKAWMFHRRSGMHTAYIGSSNLTRTAQVEGLEWNMRVSAVENPEVIERFKTTFEQYWHEPEFEDYEPERDADRVDQALSGQRPGDSPNEVNTRHLLVDVTPKPHQSTTLEALEAERMRGHRRNLVVAATGTGKTWIAAFDFKRLHNQGLDSLLFVAHREEILRQSRRVFKLVLGKPEFGELLVGGEHPQVGRHVFASIQSLSKCIDDIDPDGFAVVIVDEFHHAAAKSYKRLLSRLKPEVLLGLTATPERSDGQSVLEWFDGRIASESRLWDALDQGLLCPFHYFGVNSATDLSTVGFERGRYITNELDNLLTGDHVRSMRVCRAIEEWVTDPHRMRALGFCAGVHHAHFMASEFIRFGYPARALDSKTPQDDRRNALEDLRQGKLRAIFTVDLFNEGVDIPEVDTVLMLRPTESATVFLQQLGRGLRWAEGKQVLTVLDFVDQVRREYRYDVRYRVLLGGTRHQVLRSLENDFPLLPPGCAFKLDRISKNTVLRNLKKAVHNSRARLIDDLRALGPSAGLRAFIRDADAALEDIYARPSSGHCFTELRKRAGFDLNTGLSTDNPVLKTFGRLVHIDDNERIEAWRDILETSRSDRISRLQGRKHRLGLMLFAILGSRGQSIEEADQTLEKICESSELHREILDLLEILADRIRTVPEPIDPKGDIPLASHATYTLGEIMAAYRHTDRRNAIALPQGGVLWNKKTQTDLLFITLEKSDQDFSPSTRYNDYPISPTLFHWESQNTTSPDTPTGLRYVEQGNTNVILFVRERKKGSGGGTLPYHCLGHARYRSHESEHPMKILWELKRPMPGWLYQAAKTAAG